ncbi:MAG: stage II sporulation protein M, partial [Bdellovibrionales bacterium]|nr:stage II sporulation protein M [Bdellovibrionales bacterium]
MKQSTRALVERFQSLAGEFDSHLNQLETQAARSSAFELARVIQIHDELTSMMHHLRQSKFIDSDLLVDIEDRYFSCTAQMLARSNQTKRVLPFRKRYHRVWKQHFSLFIFTTELFAFSWIIGLYLGWTTPEYASLFLSQGLMEHILERNDWFDSLRFFPLFGGISIALNNIMVCIKVFFFSAFLALGGLLLLIFNGFNIGFIMTYCARNGFGDILTEFMVTHGILELTLIVASSFAGLIMAKEFFNRDFKSFTHRFSSATKEGLTIVVGIIPWMMLAAIFEAFVS